MNLEDSQEQAQVPALDETQEFDASILFDFEEFPPTYCLRPNCGRWDWRDGYCNHHWYLDAQNDSNF